MPPHYPALIQRRIKAIRDFHRISQEELARRTGLEQNQISRLERGSVQNPSIADVDAIASAFGFDTVSFFAERAAFERTLRGGTGMVRAEHPLLPRLRADRRLVEDIETYLRGRLVVTVDDARFVEACAKLPSLVDAVCVGHAPESPTGERYAAWEPRAYRALQSAPVLSSVFSVEAFELVGEELFVSYVEERDLNWLSPVWESLTRRGWIHLRFNDAGAVVDVSQYGLGIDGELTPTPLWSVDAEGRPVRHGAAVLPEVSMHREGGGIHVEDPLSPPPNVLPIGLARGTDLSERVVGLDVGALDTHMYLCGTTGSGKSTMLEWLAYGLARTERAVLVIDPHGPLVDNTLAALAAHAPERLDDTVLLDFGDVEHPVGFNPLDVRSAADIEPATNSVREMILKMLNLSTDSAPRAVNYVEQAVWALAECNLRGLDERLDLRFNLLQVPDFFVDREFRQLVVQFCTNLSIRSTFDPDGPFEKLGERQQLDHVMPVLRTFSSLAVKDSFGNVFGQSESKIDFAKWVRERKIVLMKLPAIASNAAVATFIGSMITPMIVASLSKWGNSEELSAYLLIDEFQNYATESYRVLLSQARKYGLRGISANQVPQDLPTDVLRGIQSNTLTKASFRLNTGAAATNDIAGFLASGGRYPTAADIASLPNHEFVISSIDPAFPRPTRLRSLPPIEADPRSEGVSAVIDRSRLEYTMPKERVREQREIHVAEAKRVLTARIERRIESARTTPPSAPDPGKGSRIEWKGMPEDPYAREWDD